MSINLLTICSLFPKNPNYSRNLYFWHSIEALKDLGVNPVLFAIDGWKPYKNCIDKSQFPIKIYSYRYFSIPRYFLYRISLFFYLRRVVPILSDIIKKNKINIIHAHGEINGLAAVALSKKFHIPSVVTIHGIDTRLQKILLMQDNVFIKVLNSVNRLVFVGNSLQQYYFSTLMSHHHHCSVIYNGFRFPSRAYFYKNKTNFVRIISVSNLHEGKGVDLTLKALGKLKKQGVDNWLYVIIGSGDQKALCEKIVAQYELNHHIQWLGECDHDQVYHELARSDVFCLPSYREAFGIAYLEAMAHGLLTIGVKGQGPEVFIKNNETGFLVEPRDVNELAKLLFFVLTYQEKTREIALKGRRHVFANFTWKAHAEKLFALYHEVCCD